MDSAKRAKLQKTLKKHGAKQKKEFSALTKLFLSLKSERVSESEM